jgi:hypothetical protein
MVIVRRTSALLLVLGLLGCGEGKTTPDAGPSFVLDSHVNVPDVPEDSQAPGDDVPVADGEDAAPLDVPAPSDVMAVLAEAATITLEVAEKTQLQLTIQRKSGKAGPLQTGEVLTFLVDGKPLALGASMAAEGSPQPAVSVWKSSELGKYWLAGARPGKAVVVAQVDGIAAEPIEVQVGWPAAPLVRMTLPTAQGKTTLKHVADTVDTIRMEGATLGAGGLTITLRFPAVAKPGDVFDLEKPPATGTVQVKAIAADLGGLKLDLLKGRVWLDQVDKGLYRGTFLGTAASLAPIAGVFVVERDGNFGVDMLDDPQLIEASTMPQPTTGVHASRATLAPIGNGQVLLTYRHIDNSTVAKLIRVVIDAKTGELDKSWAPLVLKAPTFTTDGADPPVITPIPGVGYANSASSAGKWMTTWEGRSGPDPFSQPQPNQVWYRTFDPTDGTLGDEGATVVATDDCNGQCRPQIVGLPNSRWLIAWSAPDGQGIRARRINGNLTFAEAKVVQIVQPPATGASLAVLDANVALAWTLPEDRPQFRLFSDLLLSNGPEQDLGLGAPGSRGPAIVALASPPSFLAIFPSGGKGPSPVACAGSEPKCPTGGVCDGAICSLGAQFRRIGLTASKLGPTDVDLAPGVDRVVAVAGKLGQVAEIERLPTTKLPQLRLRKLLVQKVADPGTQLGTEVLLKAKSTAPLQAVLCYVPESDVFILAWSGDATSEGVWIQRFR